MVKLVYGKDDPVRGIGIGRELEGVHAGNTDGFYAVVPGHEVGHLAADLGKGGPMLSVRAGSACYAHDGAVGRNY